MNIDPEPKAEGKNVERDSSRIGRRLPWRARAVRFVLNNAQALYWLIKVVETVKRLFLS